MQLHLHIRLTLALIAQVVKGLLVILAGTILGNERDLPHTVEMLLQIGTGRWYVPAIVDNVFVILLASLVIIVGADIAWDAVRKITLGTVTD